MGRDGLGSMGVLLGEWIMRKLVCSYSYWTDCAYHIIEAPAEA